MAPIYSDCALCLFGLIILFLMLFLIYASAHIGSNVYVRAFCRVRTNKKLIALSFDDGPHEIYTTQVLDVLKRYQAVATFFVIGSRISGNETLLQRMLSEGHQIGNHSYTHSYTFPIYRAKKMADDMLQCEDAIIRCTGSFSGWFRPPFGVTNPLLGRAVKKRNYRVAGWSIRSLDTMFESTDKVVYRVVSRLKPGAVVLLHDHLAKTPVVLDRILKQATDQGYHFVTINQLAVDNN